MFLQLFSDLLGKLYKSELLGKLYKSVFYFFCLLQFLESVSWNTELRKTSCCGVAKDCQVDLPIPPWDHLVYVFFQTRGKYSEASVSAAS